MPDRIDYARSRAVIIGTAAYQDSRFLPLPAAANSVTAMRQVLADPELCGWPDQRITVMEDPADMPRVVKTLRRLARETEEVLLLYFVGHGVILPRGRLCLVLTDTDADDPDITGLAYEWISESFLDSPARLKISILDCCYSGRAIEALSAEIADQTDARGVYTLTASDHAAHVPPLSQQAQATTSFTGELLDLVRAGIPGGPEHLTLGTLYPHLRQRLHQRGLPQPNQRGTDTADRFPFTQNAAIRNRRAGPARPGTASGAASPAARPVTAGRLSTRSDHLVLCGDNALVLRTAQDLTARYGEDVTVIVPSVKSGTGAQLTHLPSVQVIESPDLSADVLQGAGVTSARALGLLHQDDLKNFNAALRAQELNADLRFVINVFNQALGERIPPFLADSAVLDAASIAAPSFVAAALGEQAPSHLRLAGRTLYAAQRRDVRADLVVCGLADTRHGQPRILPDDQENADLVLAGSDGPPPNPLLRKRRGIVPALEAPVRSARNGRDSRPGLIFPTRRDFGLDRMTGHVIVVGLGSVGTRIISQLHDLGHKVAGIELSEDTAGVALALRLKVPVVIGPAEHEETLRAARAGHSRALVVVTGKDSINLETALNGRALDGDLRIVLRLFDDDLAERTERSIGGLDVRNVADLAAPAFVAAMLDRRVLRTIPVARRVLLIADVPVEAGSELAGLPVAEVQRAGVLRVFAVSYGGRRETDWTPDQKYRLAVGDHLFVVASRAGLSQVFARSIT